MSSILDQIRGLPAPAQERPRSLLDQIRQGAPPVPSLLDQIRGSRSWRDAAMPADQLPDDGRGIAGDTWAGITGADWSVDPSRVGGSLMAGMAGVYDAAASGAEYAANVAETIYPYTPMAAGERLGGALGGGVRSDAEREAQIDRTFEGLRAPARRAMDYWAPPEQAAGLRERPLQAILETTAQSAPTTAALAAATAASGGAALPLAFAVEAGGAHDEARERGVDRETALAKGAAVGAVNSILERTGLDKILGKGPVAAGTLQRAAAAAVTEGGTEMAQELVGIAGEVATGAQMTGEQVAERLLLSSAAGGLAGGGLSAIHSNRDRQVPVPQPGALGVADSSAQLPFPGGEDLRAWVNREFTVRGDLPEYIFAAKEQSDQDISADQLEAGFLAADYSRARDKYLKENPGVDPGDLDSALHEYMTNWGEPGAPVPPPELAVHIDQMRAAVDARTESLLASGAVPEELREVFQDNLGSYLRRSFAMHDDKGHQKRVRNTPVWNAALEYLASESPDKSPDQIEGMLEELTYHDPELFRADGGSLLGTKDVTGLRGRKALADPLLEVMGEYKAPEVNFLKTMERSSRLLRRQEMWEAIRDGGLGKDFFDEALPGFHVKIPGTETRGPVGGMRTSPRLKKALDNALEETNAGIFGLLNGYIKVGQTVGSVQAQFRNAWSNGLALAANGNGLGGVGKGFAVGSTGLWKRSDPELRELAVKAARLGVTGGNVDASEVKHYLQGLSARMSQGPKEPWYMAVPQSFQRAYQLGDDAFKLAAFDAEVSKLRKARPEASQEQIEAEAAGVVKATMQNYDRLPKVIHRLRRSPFIAPFVAFPVATAINAKNIVARGIQEIREGGKMRRVGIRRLAGLVGATGATGMISLAARSLTGSGADEEEAVKELGPRHLVGGQVAVLGKGGGKVKVLDQSFIDYWGYLKGPVLASIRAGKVDECAFEAALWKILEPLGEEMALGIVTDVMRNQDTYGQRVYQPHESGWSRAGDVLGHALYRTMPGTLRSAERIRRAATGHVEPTGRSYDLGTEVMALFGPRTYEIDVGEGFGKRARAFTRDKSETVRHLRQTLQRKGEVTGKDIRDATSEAYLSMRRIYGGLHRSRQAALRLGLPEGAAAGRMRDAQIRKSDLSPLLGGRSAEEMAAAWLAEELQLVNGKRAERKALALRRWSSEHPQSTPQEAQKARVRIAEEWAPIRLEEILQELAETGRL